jgi:quinol monooxygenase YgiN
MSVVVVATIYPLPEHRDEVIATMEKAIARVHDEDEGCELYALHEGDGRLVMIEKWTSQQALDAHSAGPVLVDLGPLLKGKLGAATDVQTMTAHPAGDAGKGAL